MSIAAQQEEIVLKEAEAMNLLNRKNRKRLLGWVLGSLFLVAPPAEAGVRYLHGDHLGSASLASDVNGTIVESAAYSPFGELLSEKGKESPLPYLYTSQELDRSTDLYYYGARYYDPLISQFLSTDPLARDHPAEDPQQQNRYAYVRNNPVIFTDPDGKELRALNTGEHLNLVLRTLQEFVGEDASIVLTQNKQGDLIFGITDVKNRSWRVALLTQLIESPLPVGIFFLSEEPSLEKQFARKMNGRNIEGFTGLVTPFTRICKDCFAEVYFKDYYFVDGRHPRRQEVTVRWVLAHELFHLWSQMKRAEDPASYQEFFSNGLKEFLATVMANLMDPEDPPVTYYQNPGDLDFWHKNPEDLNKEDRKRRETLKRLVKDALEALIGDQEPLNLVSNGPNASKDDKP